MYLMEENDAISAALKQLIATVTDKAECYQATIMPGYTHIPTQSVSRDARERTVAFYAPTKTFSLAGLIGSYHIIRPPHPASAACGQWAAPAAPGCG